MPSCTALSRKLRPKFWLTKQVLQTLGMPEAARRASALLSLPPGHAACHCGDVAATLQRQQRLSAAIRAGTATLYLDEQPEEVLGASALSSDQSQWAKTTLKGQTLIVRVYSRGGNVRCWRVKGVGKVTSNPVFSCSGSRLGVPFTWARDETCSVALISLAQPDQQPTVWDVTGASSFMHHHCIAAAPSADLLLICSAWTPHFAGRFQISLLLFGESLSDPVQHQAPIISCATLPWGDPRQIFSPDGKYVCLASKQEL